MQYLKHPNTVWDADHPDTQPLNVLSLVSMSGSPAAWRRVNEYKHEVRAEYHRTMDQLGQQDFEGLGPGVSGGWQGASFPPLPACTGTNLRGN